MCVCVYPPSQEDVRLPLLMTGPGIPVGAATGSEFQAAMTDITATVLWLAGGWMGVMLVGCLCAVRETKRACVCRCACVLVGSTGNGGEGRDGVPLPLNVGQWCVV